MINWTPGPFVPLEPARKLALVEDSEGRTVPERARDGEVVLLWLRNKFVKIEPFFTELEGAVNVRMTSNRGVLTWLQMKAEGEWADRFKALGMRLPYALGCSLRFLMRGASTLLHLLPPFPFSLPSPSPLLPPAHSPHRPKPEVQALFHSIEHRLRGRRWVARGGLKRPRVATVGIHIRVNDSVVWAGDRGKPKVLNATQVDVLLAHSRKWILCARRVEAFWFPSSLVVRWMLVTNSAQLKAAIKSRFPHKAVLYPVLRLPDLRLGARRYVEGLEDVMVRGAARFGVEARGRVPGMTGVWVGWDEEGSDGDSAGVDASGGISVGDSNITSEGGSGRKIGAVGVQISGGVTRHGLAFNISTDLSFFKLIVPCGLEGKAVTSLNEERRRLAGKVRRIGGVEEGGNGRSVGTGATVSCDSVTDASVDVDVETVTDVLIEEFVREFGFEEERCSDEQQWLR
ncbi:unnamed protein product [Closterium sp. Naga37s-1]|nr:unnamed protein product [Closterium sp. Naga37s-1]